jgi:hypothetical protein
MFMQDVCSTTPYPWHLHVLSHLLCIPIPGSGVFTVLVLLIRPTGGGQSSVHDIYSVMNTGVFLTITLLLALGANQNEKISLKAKQSPGTV